MASVVLDAGILIGFLDAEDVYHRKATACLKRLQSEDAQLLLPVSAYAECLVAPAAKSAAALDRVDEALFDLGIRVVDATPGIARRAAVLRAKYPSKLRLPEALVIATAQVIEADLVATTDTGWPRLPDVKIRVP
ncbi:MAG: type II toxin-antitoxin system VapC family toxin [Actinomycetota bacterium]